MKDAFNAAPTEVRVRNQFNLRNYFTIGISILAHSSNLTLVLIKPNVTNGSSFDLGTAVESALVTDASALTI